jgi:hypothetical protein
MIVRMVSSLLVGICFSLCSSGVVLGFGLLANAPRLLSFALSAVRSFLRGSYRLYLAIFTWLQPYSHIALQLDLLRMPTRALLAMALSVSLGLGLLRVLGLGSGWVSLLIFTLHGVVVGVAWDQLVLLGEFRLGGRIQ